MSKKLAGLRDPLLWGLIETVMKLDLLDELWGWRGFYGSFVNILGSIFPFYNNFKKILIICSFIIRSSNIVFNSKPNNIYLMIMYYY